MRGTTNSQRGTGGGGEKLVISLKTNQTSHEDLIGAKFSVVINGNATEYTWQGASMTIDVPENTIYTVEFSDVDGYATPEPITYASVAGNIRFATAVYSTEQVTVNVSADEGSISGYKVSIVNVELLGSNKEYERVEYIESDATQYIDTGFKPNQNTKVVMDTQFVGVNESITFQAFFGANDGGQFSAGYHDLNGDYYVYCNDKAKAYETEMIMDRMTVSMDGSVAHIGDSITLTYSPGEFQSTDNLYLFARNMSGTASYQSKIRVYGCQIYDNGVLIRDYIPAVDNNGVAGLYDSVNDSFVYSSIGSAFATGVIMGETIATQKTSSATYQFPYGAKYIIKAGNVSGFYTPSEQKFDSLQSSRTVKVVYKVIKLGVFIQGVSGRLYTESEWNSMEIANGIAIVTEGCKFVVAKENATSSTVYWGGYGTDIPTLTNYGDVTSATADLDGAGNTEKIIAAIGNTADAYRTGSAAGDVSAYTFPNGKTGYLGAAGEWTIARQNKDALNSALALVGGSTMTASRYSTSTESSSGKAFSQYFDSNTGLHRSDKNTKRYIRAFQPLEN